MCKSMSHVHMIFSKPPHVVNRCVAAVTFQHTDCFILLSLLNSLWYFSSERQFNEFIRGGCGRLPTNVPLSSWIACPSWKSHFLEVLFKATFSTLSKSEVSSEVGHGRGARFCNQGYWKYFHLWGSHKLTRLMAVTFTLTGEILG